MSADATRGYPGMELGVVLMLGPAGLTPPELGRAVEDSLFCAEHTHIPVDSTWADGRPVRLHADTLDPFVVLSAAAAVTSGIKLGTGACLVIERDPITLAKEVASLDRLSGGRFLFGVGAGWNRAEMANHGTDPRTRMALLADRIQGPTCPAIATSKEVDGLTLRAGDRRRSAGGLDRGQGVARRDLGAVAGWLTPGEAVAQPAQGGRRPGGEGGDVVQQVVLGVVDGGT